MRPGRVDQPRDGEAFLPPGFFDAFPSLERDRERLGPVLHRTDTPLFLVDTRILAERYREVERALARRSARSAIAYSFKTNYAVAESRLLGELGAWAEVVSGREYRLARGLGHPGEEIVFNGPHKRDDELLLALTEGALIHVNDREELERVLELRMAHHGRARVGLRVKADLPGVEPSRFGLSLEDGEAAAAVARMLSVPGLAPAGLHLHLRGDTDDPGHFREAARRVSRLLAHGGPEGGRLRVRSLDLGGGFPAHGPRPRSRRTWDPRPIGEYVDAITGELSPALAHEDGPTLILEPGRYLVADAIVFVSTVLRARRSGNGQLVTVDGTVTMLPLTHYCPQIARLFTSDLLPRRDSSLPSTVLGSSCRENDVLYSGPLPPAVRGDFLVFYAAGAYNSSLSPEFIFDAPPVLFA